MLSMAEATFAEVFPQDAGVGDSITVDMGGFSVTARIESDGCSMGAPWEEHDGHGPVSEWTRRAKRPGEIVLVKDGDAARFASASVA